MPRPRLRAKRRRDELDERHIRDLLTGPRPWGPWGNPWGNCTPDQTESILTEMRRAWEAMRDELMAEWIEERAGTRPWAWWAFDATEGRRLTSGPGCSALRDANAPAWMRRLEYGRPCVFSSEAEMRSTWESELDFLDRHGLLAAAEIVCLSLENQENVKQ